MSDKDRRKKDGREKSHDKQAMRAGPEFTKREAKVGDDLIKNEHDIQSHNPGAANDRNMKGAR